MRPSRTISGVPSTAVATTGRLTFIASQMTVGSPSLSEGRTTRSPAAIHQPTSSWATLPTNRTRSPTPSSAARRPRGSRSSPTPATTSSARPPPRQQAHGLHEGVHPFRGTSLPT